jgi:hypothetical protein
VAVVCKDSGASSLGLILQLLSRAAAKLPPTPSIEEATAAVPIETVENKSSELANKTGTTESAIVGSGEIEQQANSSDNSSKDGSRVLALELAISGKRVLM